MKIISLHIYGFGKFRDKVINGISTNFHLFYGENEAGKSTILAFIRAVLFGFPTRQQKDERYEPKSGNAYGGKLTVEIEDYGLVTIERTRGKATGDVDVYMQSGETGTEEDLKKMLAGMDRSLFYGIFSFDLKELNDISQVQSEELGKFLYGVGMSGRTSILDLEKDITKKQEELFKPKGKNPILNQSLQELEQMQKKIQVLREDEKIYAEDVKKRQKLERNILEKKNEKHIISTKIKELEKLKQVDPLFRRKKELSFQIEKLKRSVENFPVDGLKQLDEYDLKYKAILDQILDLDNKKSLVEDKLSKITYNERILNIEEDINKLQRNLAKYEQLIVDKQMIQQAISQGKKNLSELLKYLGEEWDEDRIQKCSTTFIVKEDIKERTEEIRKLYNQIDSLEVEIERRKILFDEKRLHENTLKQNLITKEKMEELKSNLDGIEQKLREKESIEQKISFLKTQNNQGKEKRKEIPLPLYVLLLFFLGFGIWSFITSQWIVTAVSIFVFMVMIWYLWDLRKLGYKRTYDEELKAMEKKYEVYCLENLEESHKKLQKLITEVEENKRRYEQMVSEREFEENFLTQLNEKKQNIVQRLEKTEERFLVWSSEVGFYGIRNPLLLADIFATVVEAKRMIEQINEESKRLEKWCDYEKQLSSIGEGLVEACKINPSSNLVYIAEKSLETIKEERAKAREKEQLLNTRTDLDEQIRLLEGKVSFYQDQKKELFESVNVADEQDFRLLAFKLAEKSEMDKEWLHINAQIYSYCSDEKEQVQLQEKWSLSREELNQLEELKEKYTELDEKIKVCERELIEIKVKLSHLENETTYTQLIQQFEMKKSEFGHKARHWAVYQMSLKFIAEAKKIYETKRQPFVLQKGCEFFQIMTNGKYTKLYAPVGESTFVVENAEGVRFTPNELSQGTAEQLYLSLRLAMACVYHSEVPFPIIMDDILVNFDAKRRMGAKKVIGKMAENHQILFFTCHQHMVNLFKDQEVHVMS